MKAILPHKVSKNLFHELGGRNGKGKFLLIFEECLYGVLDDGYLFSIASEKISLHPRAIQLRQRDWRENRFMEICAEDEFCLRDQKLFIPVLSLEVVLNRGPFWDAQPSCLPRQLPYNKVRRNLDLLIRFRGKEVRFDGSPLDQTQKERILLLELSLDRGNTREIQKAVNLLIGFGSGLTPSGDDFVIGILAGLHFVSSREIQLRQLRDRVSEAVIGSLVKTTRISQAMLIEAISGRFPYLISNLMEHCLSDNGDPETLLTCARQLMKLGASSGLNVLDGAIGALRVCCHFEEERKAFLNGQSSLD